MDIVTDQNFLFHCTDFPAIILKLKGMLQSEIEMEPWVSLFQIFLNSPFPDKDASVWFQKQLNPITSRFLSLLLTPTSSHSSRSTNHNQLIFIQTLPFFVQSRMLSFLAIEADWFCHGRLHSLATHILNSNLPSSSKDPGFWVHRAACNLLDAVSSSKDTPSHAFQQEKFQALPDWLQGSKGTATSLFPWLPKSPSNFPKIIVIADEPENEEIVVEEEEEVEICSTTISIDPHAYDRASALKAELFGSISTSDAFRIAHDIRQLCLDAGFGNVLALLELIEPWEADDETLSVLLSSLSSDQGLGSSNWPTHVLCSIALPKLLSLRNPASRVLLSATISYCKLHPVAVEEALLFPLTLHKGGVNIAICDVLTRVIKECLHPSHVSAYCQKLLCGDKKERRLVILPCHQELISEKLVWTEPMFTFFQHILNQGVYLTPDTAHELVLVLVDEANKFSRSLKFGNFFLCFVTKCAQAAKCYKDMLELAAKKTETFITKSILSKLDGQ